MPEIKVGSQVRTPGGRTGVVRRIEYTMAYVWEPRKRDPSIHRWYALDELTYLGEEPPSSFG